MVSGVLNIFLWFAYYVILWWIYEELRITCVQRVFRWDKQGLEAMLFDDGLEADDETTSTKSKNTITMSDVNDALSQKYDKLKSKLLWEMAKMSAGNSLLQNICKTLVYNCIRNGKIESS